MNATLSDLAASIQTTQDKLGQLETETAQLTRARDEHTTDTDHPDPDTAEHSRFGWLLIKKN